jgi:hypothetical protein
MAAAEAGARNVNIVRFEPIALRDRSRSDPVRGTLDSETPLTPTLSPQAGRGSAPPSRLALNRKIES